MTDTNIHPLAKLIIYSYLYVFISTGLLSLIHQVNRGTILFVDFIYLLLILSPFLKLLENKIKKRKKINIFGLILITIFIFTFIQGLFSAPNTTDAMTYHIPRVMRWLQDGTTFQTERFGSHDFMPPLPEYILLHLYSIWGSDRFLFISQWFAFVSIVFLCGEVVIQLGVIRKLYSIHG